ncbi:MAG: LysR family transcriptional regulator [Faecousia sp.]
MDFQRLAEFVSVAKYGSIKKAAQELGISSATLCARLLRFEEHLGAQLFLRSGQTMQLTAAGEHLLSSAAEILADYRRITQEVRSTAAHYYHRLRIAITGSNMPLYLGPFLDQLNLTYPDIQLDILDDSRYGIVEGIQSGEIDIYFAPVMADFDCKNLAKHSISSTQYIILPKTHPLAERSMLSIRELDGQQFLLYPKTAEPAIRTFQLRNLNDSGIRYTVYESSTSTVFYKLLIPVGKGLLLRPSSMMDLPPNCVCLPVTDLPYPATTCFFYDKSNPNPDVIAFSKDFPAFSREVLLP